MTAVAAMLRATAIGTEQGCHRCGLLPTSPRRRRTRPAVIAEIRAPRPVSVLLERDPAHPSRLHRCRDRAACDRRRRALGL